jgi:hypothetical protein
MSVEIQRVINSSTIAVLKLDAAISAGLSFPTTVTEIPVEDGGTITDHARNEPDSVTVTGFVTNTPVALLGAGADDSLARGALDSLLEMRANKEVVNVVTDVHLFENMMMTDLDVPRDAANAKSLTFTATFRKITKVSAEVIEFPDDDTERRASPPAELGKQTPAESTDDAESQASFLVRILKGTGALQ